jgi:hypothetical protein
VFTGDRTNLATDGPGPFAVLDHQGELLAVYERAGGKLKPAVVVAPAAS